MILLGILKIKLKIKRITSKKVLDIWDFFLWDINVFILINHFILFSLRDIIHRYENYKLIHGKVNNMKLYFITFLCKKS